MLSAPMHLQVISSGSKGNCALVRAGEVRALVDAGLPGPELEERLAQAGLPPPSTDRRTLHHVWVTHGHLDHARSAGKVARSHRALLHCAESLMGNAAIRRCRNLATLNVGGTQELDGLVVRNVAIPHDAHPTVAYRIEHEGRVAAILTDMGRPDDGVARALADAHVLVLEFNHDLRMLESGPYPPALKKRVSGDSGHLSNEQSAQMLRKLASANLHTLVLAHLSEKNNRPELAREVAERTLGELGIASRVKVLVASQDEIGPNLAV